MTIGERIKEKRLEKRMSLEDLANVANVARQTIYKYENNIINNIPTDKIEAIANALGVSPSYLMGWEDTISINIKENIKKHPYFKSLDLWEMEKKRERSQKEITENPYHDTTLLLNLYEQLSDQQKKAFFDLLKTIINSPHS